MNTGEVFSCPVGGWLDNGANPAGPGSRKVNCKFAGKHFEKGFRFSHSTDINCHPARSPSQWIQIWRRAGLSSGWQRRVESEHQRPSHS